ncbi:MAG: YidC/Oxa1 family membrane protein insertase [Clostridiales bacterium]|jgi:YidC/Oxa1 family membrane protein insertase|nr:YidC/Oxa1 family membrane protein insertase [Clostridiales bacterium]
MILNNCMVLLSDYIAKDQNILIKPISIFFGLLMNFFYEIAAFFTERHSLGISIILLTIAARFIMLPLALKAQKSTVKMQAVQPEVEKIRKKYEGLKDTESQQKMAREVQMVYSKNNVNMFGGCLPLLIQMPIFFALNDIMRRCYMFINKLGDLYSQIAEVIISIPTKDPAAVPKYVADIGWAHLDPKEIEAGLQFNIKSVEGLQKILNKITSGELKTLLEQVPADIHEKLSVLVSQKENIEHFAGINLFDNAGYMWPGILIPILSAVLMFASSYLMNKQQKSTDDQTKMMQNMMLFGMPIFMGITTVSFPAGVGLYWVASSAFQLGQQVILNKFYKPSLTKDSAKPADKDVVKVIKEKKK